MSHVSKQEDVRLRLTGTQDWGLAAAVFVMFHFQRIGYAISNQSPSSAVFGLQCGRHEVAWYLLSTRLPEPSAMSDIHSLQQTPKSSEKNLIQGEVNQRLYITSG